MNGWGRYEVIFTVFVVSFLIVAAEGPHAYGFYVFAEADCNCGRGVLGGQCVPRRAKGVAPLLNPIDLHSIDQE